MFNFFFGNRQQKQPSELYFKPMEDKLKGLSTEFQKVKCTESVSQFSIMLEDNITSKMDTLTKYLNNSKIYIVFMGTTSSGKSTFINALLGQQLLPSRNQSCTSQVVYIGHQNTNVNQNTRIQINELQLDSLEEASQQLTLMQENPHMGAVNIKTQSYYHTTLSKDLQERVYFIDTPGINLSHCSLKQYVHHFAKINELIELDEYSLRINVWISNYATFDSDKEIQGKMMYMSKSEAEQNQSYNFLLDEDMKRTQTQNNTTIQQSNDVSSPFFFIINKFDERKESEDIAVEKVLKDIKDVFNSEHIFKISALMALRYNVMNYGTKDAQDKFIRQFYEDYKLIIPLTDVSQAKHHCEKTIKNNHQLVQFQDFNKFTSQTSLYIKNQLNKLFHHNLLNDLIQEITLLELVNANQQQPLTQLQRDQVAELLGTFPQRQIAYEQELQHLKNHFVNSIDDLIALAKKDILKSDPQEVIEMTCQKTIAEFHKLNQMLLNMTFQIKQELFDKLRIILEANYNLEKSVEYVGPVSNILKGCYQIYQSFMDNHVYEYQRQSFQTYATELHSKMGIRVSQLQKKMGYAATGMSLASMIGSRFMMSTALVFSPMMAILGIGLLNLEFEGFSTLHFDIPLLNSNLIEWKSSLEQQVKDLVDNYIRIYAQTLFGISNLMERIIH